MLRRVLRLAALTVAVVLGADALLPTHSETVRVALHEPGSLTFRRSQRQHDVFTLHFAGGRVGSCDVSHAAYDTLRKGDEVIVDATRLLDTCDRITRDGVVVERGIDRWITLLFAVLVFACTWAWIATDDAADPRSRGPWWTRR